MNTTLWWITLGGGGVVFCVIIGFVASWAWFRTQTERNFMELVLIRLTETLSRIENKIEDGMKPTDKTLHIEPDAMARSRTTFDADRERGDRERAERERKGDK